MSRHNGSTHVAGWPAESRQAAQLVIDQYGQPDGSPPAHSVWHSPGPSTRATRTFDEHNFPAPHHDSVESVIDDRVPVIVERAAGEVSARCCHAGQENFLAINLMNYDRNQGPTPGMEGPRFAPLGGNVANSFIFE